MFKTPKRLPTMLALMATTLITTPALAETLTITDIKGGAAGDVEVTVPILEAVDASLDEKTIRDLFAKGIAGNADALAGLDAVSITIPELRVTMPKAAAEKDGIGDVVYTNIVISDVTDGVAKSVTVGGAKSALPEDGTMTVGLMQAEDFNIAALLGFYGLTATAADAPIETIYRNFSFDGATLASDEFSCKVGAMSAAEFKARPLKVSLTELIGMAKEMDEDSKPTPEQLGKIMSFYADFLTAFESSPMHFDGLDCSGKTEKGENLTFAIGPIDVDGFSPGTVPAMTVDGVKIHVENDGFVQLASIASKKIDFTSVIAAMQAAPAELTDAWFEANFRKLIPAYEGFSFSGLDMDVPDEKSPGTRIKASIADFDVTLGNYVNGIPTAISNSASGMNIPLPADSEDAKPLRDLGFTEIKADYSASLRWNETSKTIVVDHISFSGEKLGSIALFGTVGNVAAELFGDDIQTAMISAMGVTVKNIQVDLHDDGAAALAAAQAAAEQGQTPEDFRTAASGMAQGTILALLGGGESAKAVADAVGAFVTGSTPDLSIVIDAKDANGLTMADFMAAQSDPTTLIKKVDISAFNGMEGDDVSDDDAAPAEDAAPVEDAAPAEAGDDKSKDKSN